jgi:asparagine synthase (glutamine-hydrolysing)
MRVHAYSILPNQDDREDATTEWPFVTAVLGCSPRLVWTPVFCGEGMSFVRPTMHCDQLVPLDPAWPEACILAQAAQQGVRHILSGWGGDEGASFNGRGALTEALLRREWSYLVAETQHLAARRKVARWRVFAGEILPHLPGGAWLYRLRRHGSSAELRRFINPQLLASLGNAPEFLVRKGGTVRHALLTGNHLWQRTEHWNLSAAHHGMTVLFPLLDRRVVEFALSLPGSCFLRDGTRRWLFRRAMADLLPPALNQRPTKYRVIQDAHRILNACAGEARRWMSGLAGDTRVSAVLNVATLEQHLARLAAHGQQNAADGVPGLPAMLMIAAFLEQHG